MLVIYKTLPNQDNLPMGSMRAIEDNSPIPDGYQVVNRIYLPGPDPNNDVVGSVTIGDTGEIHVTGRPLVETMRYNIMVNNEAFAQVLGYNVEGMNERVKPFEIEEVKLEKEEPESESSNRFNSVIEVSDEGPPQKNSR
jgi:hypothetical protein